MTSEFYDWWRTFGISLFLIVMAILWGMIRIISLPLWLLSFGHSAKLIEGIGGWFPSTEFMTSYSPSESLMAFYYREPWLAIRVNTIVTDNFSITISKERYCGNYVWEKWKW